MSRFSSRSSVVDRMKNLGVVEEEASVGEFGQIAPAARSTPPRQPVPRLKGAASKHLSLLRARGPGSVPLAGLVVAPPSPPDSPGVFDLHVQNTYLFNQPRAETPPYSDSDDDSLPLSSSEGLPPLSAGTFVPTLAVSPKSDFAPSFAAPTAAASSRSRPAVSTLSHASVGPRRTSSPPTLEQITQRLRGAKPELAHSLLPRRHSEPPVSPSTAPVGLPAIYAPHATRAETLPSRLPKFLLNRTRTHPIPSCGGSLARVPGTPSSSSSSSAAVVAARPGSAVRPAAVPKPRMVIQEIPTFKLTPPPEREERSLALRERLARPRPPRDAAGVDDKAMVERRRSTGSEVGRALLDAPGGLRVPGL